MSNTGLLCLKWNNHISAFDKLLNNLHLKDVYSDGTIVCHGKFYPVHRFVLSTCSEYFEEIFRQSINLKSKHPFIIVKDIQPLQMEALLNYMYRGEVNVPQEMLPELVKAAEAFKIKGLAVPDDEPPQNKSFSSREKKRSGANFSSPSSQVKKSRRVDDISKSSKISSKNNEEIKNREELQTGLSSNMSKNYSSSSSQKETEEFFIPGILPTEVKSEPTDLPEYKEPVETAQPEENYLSPKELGIKEEKSLESYTTAEPFPPFKDDESLATDDQYDLAQTSSWDNSQGFEGDSNLEEGDSAQGIGGFSPLILSVCSTSNLKDGSSIDASYKTIVTDDFKIFHCSFCPYQTTNKSHIDGHVRKHTGEKPYQCPHCSFKCSLKENLRRHFLLIHARVKPHQCPHCSFKCSQKYNLKRHILIHTGVKPYQCSHCSYGAIHKRNLSKHIMCKHKTTI